MKSLIEKNRAWANRIASAQPEFFEELSKKQNPRYLWIGCSDSRVPASRICDVNPGEMFVHRNIANLVVHSDLNCQSVIQYAVQVLKVSEVIVCGHYGCGGVEAATKDRSVGLIDNWLRNIRDVRQRHLVELSDPSLNAKSRLNRLCELNVQAQVENIAATTVVQETWQQGQPLAVHGYIYGLEDGLLKDLSVSKYSAADLSESYRIE